MNIEVTWHKIWDSGALKGKGRARYTVMLGGRVKVHGVKVIEGSNGLFVSFPTEKWKDGKYRQLVFLEKEEDRDNLSKVVLDHYMDAVSGNEKQQEVNF